MSYSFLRMLRFFFFFFWLHLPPPGIQPAPQVEAVEAQS